MIGNDIIDLKVAAAESNPLRPGYIEKIFSLYEQERIGEAKEQVLQIWIFWAMKEAAYKAHQRRFDLPRHFHPKHMECKISTKNAFSVSGEIKIEQYKYYSAVDLTPQYLHATASPLATEHIFTGIFPSTVDIKEKLLNEFSALKNISLHHLSITKNQHQVPMLQFKNRNLEQAFSLSHHGLFSAFSLPLTNY